VLSASGCVVRIRSDDSRSDNPVTYPIGYRTFALAERNLVLLSSVRSGEHWKSARLIWLLSILLRHLSCEAFAA
jgi:hypothetical protein